MVSRKCPYFYPMDYNKEQVEALRRDYRQHQLQESELLAHPVAQFKHWFEAALAAQMPEPNAMTLATCNAAGRPSARIVLLKGYDEEGFVFYSNYESQKARDLEENPQAALVFCWLGLERQVRINGRVEKLSAAASERYFHSRPKGSQIGAWASPQSTIIPDRSVLEDKVKALRTEYEGQEQLPLPPDWGGYVLRPDELEFWQGRSSRLHDRLRYRREGEVWRVDRLAP